jgi:predicted Zn-dependent peptidase
MAPFIGIPTSAAETQSVTRSKTSPLRRLKRFIPLGSLLLVALTSTARAATPSKATDTAGSIDQQLELSIQRARLDNGLRVVMNVDKSSPTVAICVTYDVGSRNEVQGRSGFAHLFEHMMFQGSRNVGKGDHFTLISGHGGMLNGTTSSDRTNYFELLPASNLAMGLWLEADRMKTLAVTAENFENQRKVVQEEYRMRVSNAPYALGFLELSELVFGSYWPYAHSTIGKMEDLDRAKLEWIQDFHRSYYAPNNAVLSISGDFEPDTAMALVREYFSAAKPTQIPEYRPPADPSAQTEARTFAVTDNNVNTPGLFWGWVIPPNRHPEHYALELATLILANGESSRFHQTLVRDLSLARSVSAWTNDQRGPDLLALKIVLSEQATPKQVTEQVTKMLDEFRKRGPTEAEVEKAKNQLLSYLLFSLEGNMGRAQQLGIFEVFWGDARLLTRELDHYLAVTPTQIQRAVATYLSPSRQNLLTVLPPAATPPAANEKRGN